MMNPRLYFSFAALSCFCLAVPATAATLTQTTTTLSQGIQGDGIVDISVFPGDASYAGVGIVDPNGIDPTVPVPQTQIGDGTVLDFAFYNDDNVEDEATDTLIAPYVAGPSPRIGEFNVVNGITGGGTRIRDDGGVTFFDVWRTTDSAGFASDNPDFNGNPNDSAARVATAEGVINLGGLASGTVYVFYGTFQNDNQVTATLSGAGQVDVVTPGDVESGEGLSGNSRALNSVTAFSFTTDNGLYDSLKINYVSQDQDSSPGSRARFAGVVIDGVSLPPNLVPEPSSLMLLGFASATVLAGRRRS